MTFLLADPKEIDYVFCPKCLDSADHLAGVSFEYDGISPAWRCAICGHVQLEDDGNPFKEINDKLDKLLKWSGHDY